MAPPPPSPVRHGDCCKNTRLLFFLMTPPPKAPAKAAAKATKYAPSIDALAHTLNIDPRTVKRWKTIHGFPAKTAQGYPVAAVRKFINLHRRDNAHREQTPEEKAERLKLLRAKRIQAELQLEEQRGRLVPATAAAETVGALYSRQCAYFGRILESEPPKLAKLGSVEEIREHMRKIVNDLIAEQREYLRQENEKLRLAENES